MPSYRGLQVTVVHRGQPVILTEMVRVEADGVVLTSLRVPLIAVDGDYDPEQPSHLLRWHAWGPRPDMAADLAYVLEDLGRHPERPSFVVPDGDGQKRNRDTSRQTGSSFSTRIFRQPGQPPGLFGLSELCRSRSGASGHDRPRPRPRSRLRDVADGRRRRPAWEVHVFAARIAQSVELSVVCPQQCVKPCQ